jgi:NADH:ubiquinone oxidoreductase subunit 6 (subunit J)
MDSIDIFIYVAEILIVVGAVIAVVMPLIKSLDNPGSLVKTAVGVAILVVVFFIAYSISDGEVLPKYAAEPFNLTPGMSKFVGGSLITIYALFIFAIFGIILTEINKAIK